MIHYTHSRKITPPQFVDVLERSGLAARRPVTDAERIAEMLNNANLIVTAWKGESLIGIARALTDFSYCCYLSDLAVDKIFQRQGVGKRLVAETHRLASEKTTLILLASPDAMSYYPCIGMEKIDNGFLIRRK